MTAVQAIGTFNLQRIQQIVPELQRQRQTKRDFLAGGPKFTVTAAGDELRLKLSDVKTFRLSNSGRVYPTWQEAETNAEPGEKIEVLTDSGEMPLTRMAQRQLCQAANFPIDTVDRYAKEGQADLAAHTINERFRRARKGIDSETATEYGGRFLVRTLDGKCRALLSPSYRVLDTVDLFFAAADEFDKVQAEPWRCDCGMTDSNS